MRDFSFIKIAVKRTSPIFIPFLITLVTLLFYGFLKTWPFIIILAIFFLIYLKAGFQNSIIFSVVFFLATIFLNLFVGLFLEDKIYYRPHEKLSVYNHELGRKLYKKNVDMLFYMPFGDIRAVGSKKDIDIEPRKIRFKTDSLGFRNNSNYNGEAYVIVGDSFIAANGTTQEDMITSQIENKWGKRLYALGYAGGIPEYVRYVMYLKNKTHKDFKVLLFLFEGNDFPEYISKRQMRFNKPPVKKYYERIMAFFEDTPLYKYTYSLLARLKVKHQLSEVLHIRGHKIGEFKDYIDVTERKNYKIPNELYSILHSIHNHIEHIFFIPTKYRVYFPFIENRRLDILPDAQWEATQKLARELGVGCTNLTRELIKESERLLKEDKFTFWKDDSHWNGYGIYIAAKAVNDYLNSIEQKK